MKFISIYSFSFLLLFFTSSVLSETITIKTKDGTVITIDGSDGNVKGDSVGDDMNTGKIDDPKKTDSSTPTTSDTNPTSNIPPAQGAGGADLDCENIINDAKDAATKLKYSYKEAIVSRHAISKMRVLASIRSYYTFSDISKINPLENEDLKKINTKILELKTALTSEANEELKKVIEGNIKAKEREYNSIFLNGAWNAIVSANEFALKKDYPELKLDSFDKNYFFSYFKDRPDAFDNQTATPELLKKDLGYLVDNFLSAHKIELDVDKDDIDLISSPTVNENGKIIFSKNFEDNLRKVLDNNKQAHDLTKPIFNAINKKLVESMKSCLSFMDSSVYSCQRINYYDQSKIQSELDPLYDVFRYLSENTTLPDPDLYCKDISKSKEMGINEANWISTGYNCKCSKNDDSCCLISDGFHYSTEGKFCFKRFACTKEKEVKVEVLNKEIPKTCECESGYRWDAEKKICADVGSCKELNSNAYFINLWSHKDGSCSCSANNDSCCNASGEDGKSYRFQDGKCIARSLLGDEGEEGSSGSYYDFSIIKKKRPSSHRFFIPQEPIIILPGQL